MRESGNSKQMAESPFQFADTASARQKTTDLALKLEDEKVGIIGLGGTGSFILDFVAKTWVNEIHLFDCDEFKQHNAFRAPGPFGLDELCEVANKAVFHGDRYSRMHRGISAHPVNIDESSVHLLDDCSTVFLCVDGGSVKSSILRHCVANDVLAIDCGMGVKRIRTEQELLGILRVTTCTKNNEDHIEDCIDLSNPSEEDEYERNVQLAELNALNAALAVIKWKKIRGIYADFSQELHTVYVIDGNRLISRYKAEL